MKKDEASSHPYTEIIKQNELIWEVKSRNIKAQRIIEDFVKSDWKIRDNRIFSAIDQTLNCSSKDCFTVTIPAETNLYRARIIKDSDILKEKGIEINTRTKGFNEQESMEPPLGKGVAGRNNIAGMSYLYLAEDEATACAEVKPIPKDAVSLATIMVQKELRIYCPPDGMYTTSDDSYDLGSIVSEISMLFYRPVSDEEGYHATQVIADYIRKVGFDGFRYRSFFTGSWNYTIFNSHPTNFKFIGSKVVVSQGSRQFFWDENEHKCIKAENKDLVYEDNHSVDVLQFMKERLCDP